jgi:prevent-host-death family protein
MTIQVNIAQAKARLSELVARAEAGEEVIIARYGKPAVTLSPRPRTQRGGRRILGAWAHLGPLTDPDLFLRPDPEIDAWVDRPMFPDGVQET